MARTIRAVVIDEYALIRQGIRLVLETDPSIRVVDEAESATAALSAIERAQPSVIVMDVASPGHLQLLKEHAPDSRILLLSQCRDEPFVAAMVRAGTDGYLLKSCTSADLIRAVRILGEETQHLPLIDRHVQVLTRHRRVSADLLSGREREILALVAEGHTTKGIARKLQVSPRTVGNHRARIMAKLQVDNCVQAIARALQLGLIGAPAASSLVGSGV